jgi:hypothetical protein
MIVHGDGMVNVPCGFIDTVESNATNPVAEVVDKRISRQGAKRMSYGRPRKARIRRDISLL